MIKETDMMCDAYLTAFSLADQLKGKSEEQIRKAIKNLFIIIRASLIEVIEKEEDHFDEHAKTLKQVLGSMALLTKREKAKQALDQIAIKEKATLNLTLALSDLSVAAVFEDEDGSLAEIDKKIKKKYGGE